MKTYLPVFFCFFLLGTLHSQTFLNGDFEDNLAITCDYNNSNVSFNAKITGVVAFGDEYLGDLLAGGEVDLQTYDCYVDPFSGDWCLGIAGGTGDPEEGDALSIELDQALVAGDLYSLRFHVFGNTTFTNVELMEVGVSSSPVEFGQSLLTLTPLPDIWMEHIIEFEAPANAKYITARVTLGQDCWFQIDDFSIERIQTSSASTQIEPAHQLFPNPVHDRLTIAAASMERIECYNLSGRILLDQDMDGQDQIDLDLSMLPSGSFILLVHTQDGLIREPLIRL